MPETSHAPSMHTGSSSLEADDTEALTLAVARGDTRAFGVLYERWFDRAFEAARKLTGRDEAFCLDVAQDAMLKAARRVPRLRDRAALSAWLCRVVHRAALDQLRKDARRRARERRPLEADGRSASDDERIAWLEQRLELLSSEDRGILTARFFRRRSLEQVGSEFGISGDAAHGKIRRIVHRLRQAAKDA